ncbi:TPA: hypothetical protein ONB21_001721 [Pseudomonas aeruginosa]|nr:hypothetical protein [Pseudomonas aeruginosa]
MQKLLNAKGLRTPVWLIALLIGFLFLQACQAGPDMVSTPIGGYNQASAAINRLSVNGAGGLNLDKVATSAACYTPFHPEYPNKGYFDMRGMSCRS